MYQKGRTAIELFSVLLIIGLMTVAGVEMYNYTFSKTALNTAYVTSHSAACFFRYLGSLPDTCLNAFKAFSGI